jgi:signal transduction histidine kinase/ActR/RegA family two-component response regulator
VSQPSGSQAASPWTLDAIGAVVSPEGDPGATLENIVQLVQRRFEAAACSLYLLESERATLVLSAGVGVESEGVGRLGVRVGDGSIGVVGETRQPDLRPSSMVVPLVQRGLLQGVIVLQAAPSREFGDADLQALLSGAAQLAPIVSHARVEARHLIERRLVQRAKAELLETLAAGIAHELNNKLMPITSYAELMLEEIQPLESPDLVEGCNTIRDSAFEAAHVLERLVQLATTSPAVHGSCDFADVARQALAAVRPAMDSAGVTCNLQVPAGSLTVCGDAEQLKDVCLQLLTNAVEAMAATDRRELTVQIEFGPGHAVLTVADTGRGIDPEIMPRVFDPYFTTKESRSHGVGLGVSLGIVKQHGGDIRISSKVGSGTTIRVALPVRPGEQVAVPARASAPVARFETRRALVIDDDERMLDLVAAMLESRLGCRVERAKNGLDARSAIEKHEFDLVLSDVRMPHMDGVELLEWITSNRPDVLRHTMFMTGDPSGKGAVNDIQRSGRPLLRKPFSLDALVNAATRVISVPSADDTLSRKSA